MKRYRITIIILIAFFFVGDVKAQNKKKDIVINVGVYSGYGYHATAPFGGGPVIPVSGVGAEYYINQYISIGPYIAYTYDYDEFIGTTQRTRDVWRGWDIGIKPALHFNPFLPEQAKKATDIYIAAFAGYAYRALRYDKSNIYRNELNYDVDGLSAGAIIGLRYIVYKKMALYGEVGMGSKPFIGGGVAFTLNGK